MHFLFLVLGWAFVCPALGVFWYQETGSPRCFYDNLVRGTLVQARFDVQVLVDGVYTAPPGLEVEVTISETFDSNHVVMHQRTSPSGGFAFDTTESGEHKVCITPVFPAATTAHVGYELMFGELVAISDSSHLNYRLWLEEQFAHLQAVLEELKRTQTAVRAKELLFKLQSDTTNLRVAWWCALQTTVFGAVCYWQLRQVLRTFVKQKVV